MNVLEVKQHIYFSRKELVPIGEMADSLKALEALIRMSPDVLRKLDQDLIIDDIQIFIPKLTGGSLTEDVLIKFVFGSQQKFDEIIQKSRTIAIKNITEHKMISSIVLMLILSGGTYAYKAIGNDPKNAINITGNYNVIINDLSKRNNIPVNVLSGAIEEVFNSNPEKITDNSMKFLKPAKQALDGMVIFDKDKNTQINHGTIREIPSDYVRSNSSKEFSRDFQAVNIHIRAIDVDKFNKGWAGVIDEIGEKRIKIELMPNINRELLLGKRMFKADISVYYKNDRDGVLIPNYALITNIHIKKNKAEDSDQGLNIQE